MIWTKFKALLTRKDIRSGSIITLGSSRSGKTTLTRFLETGEPILENINTTIGMNVRKEPVVFENKWEFTIIDMGGQERFFKLWEIAIENADVVFFVIDATIRPDTNHDEFLTNINAFKHALTIADEDTPFIILLNEQDMKKSNPISTSEFYELYPIELLGNERTVGIEEISAKYGTNVMNALEWAAKEALVNF